MCSEAILQIVRKEKSIEFDGAQVAVAATRAAEGRRESRKLGEGSCDRNDEADSILRVGAATGWSAQSQEGGQTSKGQ